MAVYLPKLNRSFNHIGKPTIFSRYREGYLGGLSKPPPNSGPFNLHHLPRGCILEYELKSRFISPLNISTGTPVFDRF